MLQILLTAWDFLAVTKHKLSFYFWAITLHAAIDFLAGAYQLGIVSNLLLIELILAIYVLGIGLLTRRIWRKEGTHGLSETLKAISAPVRREILDYLKSGPKSAGEISQQFDLAPATVSHHLSTLRKAGLIEEEKQKNFIYYSLNLTVFEEILTWIQSLGGKENEK